MNKNSRADRWDPIFNFRLQPSIADRTKRIAKAMGTTSSAIARDALIKRLEELEAESTVNAA